MVSDLQIRTVALRPRESGGREATVQELMPVRLFFARAECRYTTQPSSGFFAGLTHVCITSFRDAGGVTQRNTKYPIPAFLTGRKSHRITFFRAMQAE